MTGPQPSRAELRYARRRTQRRVVGALLAAAALLTLALTYYLARNDDLGAGSRAAGAPAGSASPQHAALPGMRSW